ncbi:MAG: glycosyltransferase family 9 protein [Sphingobacteriales bacterium]|nr:MAG: glycosyltransferase family 9 protein [Sphingobacteriales bacterium]
MAHRFLLIQTAFLGDVVLATAVAEKLHAFFPDATIDFVVRKGAENLLANNPHLRTVWVWDKKKGKGFNLLKLAFSLRREGYTHTINMQRFFTSGLLTVLSGAPVRIGFDKNPLSAFYTLALPHVISGKDNPQPVHELERNQSLIAALTDETPALPRVYPSAIEEAAILPHKQAPYYCISPASVWATKQYPTEGWSQLINTLPDTVPVYLLGGPGDTDLCESIRQQCTSDRVQNLSGTCSLLASAALMRDALHNWTNDSAPLHLCTATGARVTAVFCSTIPQFGFGPAGLNGRIAQFPGDLYCRPCGLHGHKVCPEGHFRCAREIPLSDLRGGLSGTFIS